jgi:hypothetical protein
MALFDGSFSQWEYQELNGGRLKKKTQKTELKNYLSRYSFLKN